MRLLPWPLRVPWMRTGAALRQGWLSRVSKATSVCASSWKLGTPKGGPGWDLKREAMMEEIPQLLLLLPFPAEIPGKRMPVLLDIEDLLFSRPQVSSSSCPGLKKLLGSNRDWWRAGAEAAVGESSSEDTWAKAGRIERPKFQEPPKQGTPPTAAFCTASWLSLHAAVAAAAVAAALTSTAGANGMLSLRSRLPLPALLMRWVVEMGLGRGRAGGVAAGRGSACVEAAAAAAVRGSAECRYTSDSSSHSSGWPGRPGT
mmetsp:Transcript_586/g.1531  ORF Transcript_586/g.1531 Transcript_586/m.1531 type:complete len:258 (-) Transcript_586:977-1750(-)